MIDRSIRPTNHADQDLINRSSEPNILHHLARRRPIRTAQRRKILMSTPFMRILEWLSGWCMLDHRIDQITSDTRMLNEGNRGRERFAIHRFRIHPSTGWRKCLFRFYRRHFFGGSSFLELITIDRFDLHNPTAAEVILRSTYFVAFATDVLESLFMYGFWRR